MGKECKQILNHLGLTNEELKKSSTIFNKHQEHFVPACNMLYERYHFHSAEQQPNESADQFVSHFELRVREATQHQLKDIDDEYKLHTVAKCCETVK